jgi:hypothetical protein
VNGGERPTTAWNINGSAGRICATEFSCESGGCRESASACRGSGGGMSPGLLAGTSGGCSDIFAGKGTCRLAAGFYSARLCSKAVVVGGFVPVRRVG